MLNNHTYHKQKQHNKGITRAWIKSDCGVFFLYYFKAKQRALNSNQNMGFKRNKSAYEN